MSTESELWVVDRIEGRVAVLVSDDGEVLEARTPFLPPGVGEGTVLRVPRDAEGLPDWVAATVDEEAARRRREEAEKLLERLKRRDPGGDVTL